MIFRCRNDKVGADLDAMHSDDGNCDLVQDDNLVLQFRCECFDENCDNRMPLSLSDYVKIHRDRDTFIVKPNHQVVPIETVVREETEYSVVKKNNRYR